MYVKKDMGQLKTIKPVKYVQLGSIAKIMPKAHKNYHVSGVKIIHSRIKACKKNVNNANNIPTIIILPAIVHALMVNTYH